MRPQRDYPLREGFDGLRWIVRTGARWRWLPHDLPPWLVRDYERLPHALAGLDFLAFAILLFARFAALVAEGA